MSFICRFHVALLLSQISSTTFGIDMEVGTHFIQENTTSSIDFRVTPELNDRIAGLNFNIQIGDGRYGPVITSVDIVGPSTIFAESNTGQRGAGSFAQGGFPGLWEATTTTDPGIAPTIVPDGIVARVTIDATGFDATDGPFDLILSNTLNGPSNIGVPPPDAPDTTLNLLDGKIFILAHLVGDCDENGALDANDLACVATIEERDAVLAALNTLLGDLDGNGDVAFADFLVLANNFNKDLSSYTDGNIDLTGGVVFADFVVLSTNFGLARAAAWDDGDFDFDGVVGFSDFLGLSANFGRSSNAAVPEPSSLTLLGIGLLFLRRRRYA